MRYTVKEIIYQHIDKVVFHFYDPNAMMQWQPTLEKLETIQGTWPETGFFGNLHYQKGLTMQVEVLKNDLPTFFSLRYQIMGVKNTCEYTFVPSYDHTEFIMDVLFEFEDKIERDSLPFIQTSEAILRLFKQYVESK